MVSTRAEKGPYRNKYFSALNLLTEIKSNLIALKYVYITRKAENLWLEEKFYN